MRFYTYSNQTELKEFHIFLKSAKRNNIAVNVLSNETSHLDSEYICIYRFKFLLEELEKLPNNEIISFTDAHDVLYLKDEKSIEKEFLTCGHKIIFNAEKKTTWHLKYIKKYFNNNKMKGSPYFSLNAGCFIGYNKPIQKMIKQMLNSINDLKDRNPKTIVNDQTFLGKYFKNHRNVIGLDYYGKIFWNTSRQWDDVNEMKLHNGKVFNKFVNSYPSIIHIPKDSKRYIFHNLAKKLKLC